MTKDEALRMAIEALEDALTKFSTFNEMQHEAIQACKDALENLEKDPSISRKEQPAQEPVAWMNDIAFSMDKELLGTRSRIVPLYGTPPSREWIGLSDWDYVEIYGHANLVDWRVVRAIEAKLKERNE